MHLSCGPNLYHSACGNAWRNLLKIYRWDSREAALQCDEPIAVCVAFFMKIQIMPCGDRGQGTHNASTSKGPPRLTSHCRCWDGFSFRASRGNGPADTVVSDCCLIAQGESHLFLKVYYGSCWKLIHYTFLLKSSCKSSPILPFWALIFWRNQNNLKRQSIIYSFGKFFLETQLKFKNEKFQLKKGDSAMNLVIPRGQRSRVNVQVL